MVVLGLPHPGTGIVMTRSSSSRRVRGALQMEYMMTDNVVTDPAEIMHQLGRAIQHSPMLASPSCPTKPAHLWPSN